MTKEWSGLGSLDLTGVEANMGSARLAPGSYSVTTTKAEILDVKGAPGNKRLTVSFLCEDGHGDITHNFNVHNRSEQAQEIGLRQLKGFLVAAGHPNPDRPGDVSTMEGLSCVIVVGEGKPWRNRDGEMVTSTEVKKFMPAGSPHSGPAPAGAAPGRGAARAKAGAGAGGSGRPFLDDDIPPF